MNKYAIAFAHALDAKQARNLEIAQKLNVDPSYVSQWKLGRRPIPPDKAIGVAAMLEVAPQEISEAYARLLQAGFTPEDMDAGVASAPGVDGVPRGHLQLEMLAGFGRLVDGLRHVVLPEFLVQQKIGQVPLEQVRWAVNPSKAMAPAIEHGALLLIDAGVTSHEAVVDGLTYAYQLRGRADVRRILLRQDRWIVTGSEAHPEQQNVSMRDRDQLTICGQVLGVC
jgi:DNA-binding transcriptional regulator YdaS (Cro superfamily)